MLHVKDFFATNGVIHQKSVSYSPQQNGRLERKHQQLLQIARSFMSQSGLPIKFWGHSILMATYVINLLPTKVLNWETPYKRLFKKDPDYSNLRVFGCLCVATNTKPHKTKFESRAIKCCFIGYNQGQKAFKLYDLQEQKILMSRDVVFYEEVFPYKDPNFHVPNEPVIIPNPIQNDNIP